MKLVVVIVCMLLLSFVCYASSEKVALGCSASEIDSKKLLGRMNYVLNLEQTVLYTVDNERLTIIIRQNLLDRTKVCALDAALYVRGSNSEAIELPGNFKTYSDNSFTYLSFSYTFDQLTENYGWKETSASGNAMEKYCRFMIDYLGTESYNMVLLTVGFTVRLRVTGTGISKSVKVLSAQLNQ